MKHIHTESALAEGCHHLSYFYFFLVRVKYSIHGKYKRSIVPSVSIFSPGEFLPYLRATFFFFFLEYRCHCFFFFWPSESLSGSFRSTSITSFFSPYVGGRNHHLAHLLGFPSELSLYLIFHYNLDYLNSNSLYLLVTDITRTWKSNCIVDLNWCNTTETDFQIELSHLFTKWKTKKFHIF